MRDAEGALVGTRGHVQQVDVRLQDLGDFHALVEVVALGHELRAGEAELDRETGADSGADGLQNLDGEAAAVLGAPAVLVAAVVEHGREELVDEPAVAPVDHQHLKARALAESRHMAVGRDDLGDHLLAHGLIRHTVRTHAVVGRPLVQAVGLVLVGHVGSGEHAGVRKLCAGDGAVAADGVGGVGGLGQGVQNALVQTVGVASVAGVHHQLADRDRRAAALGAVLVKGLRLGADAAVQLDVRAAHGGGEHAVAIPDVADADGLAKVRVLAFHGVFLLLALQGCVFAHPCINLIRLDISRQCPSRRGAWPDRGPD